MNRRGSKDRLRRVGRWAAWGTLGSVLLALLGLLGCTSLPRLQSEEEPTERYGVDTIGDKTVVGNAAPIPIGGVGLVEGLEGTGGDCPHDSYRAVLEDDLLKDGYRNVKEALTSPECAMVFVSGRIDPGSSKGDRIDLEVTLPRGSKATSLRGGYLHSCRLFNYDFAERLNPNPNGPRGMLRGHAIVIAEGKLMVGLGDSDDAVRVKHARIWGGGRFLTSAPFSIIIKSNQPSARLTALIAERINELFQAGFHGEPGAAVAEAKNRIGIQLRVPPQYRLNTPRFLRVVRFIPLSGQLDLPSSKGDDRRSYRQKLADDLLDPAHTVAAALRLEALGQVSEVALKKGLDPKNHPLVRFCAAETLAYLGDPACGQELAAAVAKQPALRAFGLTALASLDEGISHVKLGELLTTSRDDEVRYGAFRALRTLNPRDPLVRGEHLNQSFWLHRVAPNTPPLVHISSMKRAEIVVFGEEPRLKPDFGLSAGEFIVTATKDDNRCSISRVPLHGSPTRRTCSLELMKVLHLLADMGCMYPETVTILEQADSSGALSCRLRCDAFPQAVSVEELAQLGQKKGEGGEEDIELIPAGQDLGVTPTLFDKGLSTHSARVRQQQLLLDDSKTGKRQ